MEGLKSRWLVQLAPPQHANYPPFSKLHILPENGFLELVRNVSYPFVSLVILCVLNVVRSFTQFLPFAVDIDNCHSLHVAEYCQWMHRNPTPTKKDEEWMHMEYIRIIKQKIFCVCFVFVNLSLFKKKEKEKKTRNEDKTSTMVWTRFIRIHVHSFHV